MFFHPLYLLFVGPTLLLALWAQYKVKKSFAKFSRVGLRSDLTGAQAAAKMLHERGLTVVQTAAEATRKKNSVAIECIDGFLSDHYDPRSHVLRLSDKVYHGRSLAAVGVACHEAGHAMQHARNYVPLEVRSLAVPVAQFGSPLAIPLIIIGAIFPLFKPLILVGLLLFSGVVIFQLITLPVEFNASKRAKKALKELNIIHGNAEISAVDSVLNAAALTYVAAAASSIMTLLYYIMIFAGGSDD